MNLQNGYIIMYEARERMSEEKPGPLYACKQIPVSINDAMLISTNNGGEYVDCRTFKLIYCDGKHIFGSTSKAATKDDVNIVIVDKIGPDGKVVFGEKIETPVVEAEVAEAVAVEAVAE